MWWISWCWQFISYRTLIVVCNDWGYLKTIFLNRFRREGRSIWRFIVYLPWVDCGCFIWGRGCSHIFYRFPLFVLRILLSFGSIFVLSKSAPMLCSRMLVLCSRRSVVMYARLCSWDIEAWDSPFGSRSWWGASWDGRRIGFFLFSCCGWWCCSGLFST